MAADAPAGQWLLSSDVEIDDISIGNVRTRRLADGRIEMGFQEANGKAITPDIRYLASDIPTGVWLRSSQIEVQRVTERAGQLE